MTALCSAALLLGVFAVGPNAEASGEASASASTSGSASGAAKSGWMYQHLPENHMLELGVWGGVLIPSRRHEWYDPAVVEQSRYGVVAPDFGLRFAYLPLRFLGAEIEGGLMPTRTATDESALLYAVRGHAIGQLPFWRIAPFLVVGGGGMGVTSDDAAQGKDIDRAFHWGPGAKLFINRWLAFRLDLRHVVTAKVEYDSGLTSHFEALAGLSVTFRTRGEDESAEEDRDPDGDGFWGQDDECPDEPGTYPDGCPAPDRDDDGVADAEDECPDEPGQIPSGCPAPDRDEDGVADDSDQCPDEPGTKPDGCPVDSDGDGVADPQDHCPEIAGDGPDGCPPDSDGDGVFDPDDECEGEAETQNGFEDEDGCEDELPQRLRGAAGVMPGITFEVNSARITPESKPALDAAVETLENNPKYIVKVEGHTDSTGSRDHNIILSARRADAVKKYMVDHGVDANRVETRGRGPDRPKADNSTAEGRAENRRIEFKLRRGKPKAGKKKKKKRSRRGARK